MRPCKKLHDRCQATCLLVNTVVDGGMPIQVYMSAMSPCWPYARQSAALEAVLPGAVVFREDAALGSKVAGAREGSVQRARMLHGLRVPEDVAVHVASLAVLARTAEDMASVLAALAASGTRLVSAAEGEPGDLLGAWRSARDRCRASVAGQRGGAAIRERAAEVYRPRVEAIRGRWGNPAHGTAALLFEAGVSRNTANKYLGIGREAAVAEHAARLRHAGPGEA